MRLAAVTVLAFATIAAPAAAQATATATPNKSDRPTEVHVELDATQPPVLGRLPRETVLSIQSGYRFDGRAVARRCTPDQAERDACPARSAVGTALVTATCMGSDVPVPVRLYLTRPQQTGDLAGFAVIAEIFGGSYSAIGCVVRSTEDPFGLAVILPAPGPDASFSGVTFKGRKGKRRKVRYALITNPRECSGSWASRAAFEFSDGTRAQLDAAIDCIP